MTGFHVFLAIFLIGLAIETTILFRDKGEEQDSDD